ncbi:hypothetical protein A2239_04065 [Candidatus Uhrbacteria bacterium RIFOXYA2_FULL_40_9]|nr:MAG: hypothetical protein UT94_C0016G0008 [Candidatus Uhrbacteria bacterium GW2011_GWF2_40_263]OGL94193.1 MAG: hypothetical protein A2239_04065 [Candidatus Uhrbacteria bacterium RIFOXYA2_FULL_40_9]OGL98207.1 MAG: hypothetical protein A2332_03820 [Candidatus Uhrbacteria bacterium RIFOXYB2_FULL_41_18]HBK35167.1 hypothetical protein [Candidatus Uhrbacteria bacterium]HCB56047.1 hypothetical protein [Candidatus Uhrbacteria bacterium]
MLNPFLFRPGNHLAFDLLLTRRGTTNVAKMILDQPESFEVHEFDRKNLQQFACPFGRPHSGRVHVKIRPGFNFWLFQREMVSGIRHIELIRLGVEN